MGKRYTPSGIKVSPLAAFAALIGEFIFVGLLLIGMDLNFDVDMHVMLAPVSYNHLSVIAGDELISIRGLLSSCNLIKRLVFPEVKV